MSTFTLHEDPTSGNCYKICLTAAFTNTSIKRKSYSVLKGETRTPEFLRDVSFFGRTPVLQIDHEDGKRTMLAESNAACWYMAEVASTKSSSSSLKLIPDDSLQKAEMLKWMFFEQNKHETSVATLRFWLSHIGRDKLGADRLALVEGKRKQAEEALSNMNEHLDVSAKDGSGWFVAEHSGPTLADVVLYAYTHVAHEGELDMSRWPAIQKWLRRVEGVHGYVAMRG